MPRPPKYHAVAAASLAPAPTSMFIGTSGWSYPTWKPGFYPAEIPSRAFLHYYASCLTSVEVNHTFRKALEANVLQSWLEATPPGFRFAFKAPEQITHRKRLLDCHAAVGAFVESVQPARAAGKLGPLLFQLAPNFKANMDRLAHLLQAPCFNNDLCQFQVALEFRHPSWFCEETYALLRKHSVALCVADSDDLTTPDVVTAPYRYYRFRQSGGYSARTLAERAKVLTQTSQTAEVFAYLKHEDAPTGALNALELIKKALAINSGEPRS